MRQIQQVNFEKLGFHERLQHELSRYPEKNIHEDGAVTIKAIKNSYFLTNDSWNIEFLGGIKQFEDTVAKYKNTSKNINFRLGNPIINLEVKYVYYQQLFNDYWTITSIFMNQNGLRRMTDFINDKYPNLSSILELEIEKAEKEYLFWLNEKGINTLVTKKKVTRKDCIIKTNVAAFLRIVYTALFQLTDIREEWEKDRWDVRILHDSYGIAYNKSINVYHIDFTKIENVNIRGSVKKYIKQRLLSNNNFSWSTAFSYLNYLPSFFSFIISLEPSWIDLKALQRAHMEKYIQWLNEYAKNNLKRKNSHPEHHVLKSLTVIGKFLEDIQLYEYNIAPKKNVRLLLFPEDKPKLKKKSIDQVDYIPDFVLDQLFTHINDLHKEVIPVVWIAFKTGLRISDVLGLTSNCLECLNGKFSIVTDIEKTYVHGHRIPIDDDLANILAVLIQKSKGNSNQDNNPEGFIFIRYRGIRKGKPFSQNWVQEQLLKLAIEKNIVDENGNLFHFKTHQFRHTYAIKMLNNGADILTVQALLAHASPEMTLR